MINVFHARRETFPFGVNEMQQRFIHSIVGRLQIAHDVNSTRCTDHFETCLFNSFQVRFQVINESVVQLSTLHDCTGFGLIFSRRWFRRRTVIEHVTVCAYSEEVTRLSHTQHGFDCLTCTTESNAIEESLRSDSSSTAADQFPIQAKYHQGCEFEFLGAFELCRRNARFSARPAT
jgi:hypothetical protein